MEGENENFSEEEWDISHDQLEALEQNAILSTQQPLVQQKVAATSVQDEEPNRSRARDSRSYDGTNTMGGLSNEDVLHDESLDNLIFDEENLSFTPQQEEPYVAHARVDETTKREQWRLNRFAPEHQVSYQASRMVPQNTYQTHNNVSQRSAQVSFRNPEGERQNTNFKNTEHDALRTMIEDLKRERDILTQNLTSVNIDLRTARGEIAIIREQNAKGTKSFERQMDLLKKQMQDEKDKHQATILAKDAAHEREVTSRTFLKHELDEQIRKIGSLQQQLKEKPFPERTNDVNLTPRKTHANSLRDGFEDDEVMAVSPIKSPAKSGRRSKPSTPANRKRKQAVGQEEPIQPLPLILSNAGEEAERPTMTDFSKHVSTKPVIRRDYKTKRDFQLVQQVLNYRPLPDRLTLVEHLIRYKFPSDPSQSISSHLLAATSLLKGDRIPGNLLQIFVDLWAQSLRENYHKPIRLLLKAAIFLIDVEPTILDADIVRNFLPVLQTTAEYNAEINWHLSRKTVWDDDKNKKPQFNRYVDTEACLDLLYTIACLVMDDPTLIVLFWRTIVTDHVLLMLNSCQPIPVITLMLKLLSTSIRPETFGNICGTEDEQLKMETYIVDRVCFLFWETLKLPETRSQRYTRREVCRLRLDAHDLLAQFAIPSKCNVESHHGTVFLVNHPTAIARLVRSIYDELDNMYNMYPSSHTLHAELVNSGVRILHHLLTSPQAESIDLPKKLRGTTVGGDKFRVVLTRLAFREGIYIDKGITDETVNKATEILEDHVTPDEAIALLEAFGRSPDGGASKLVQ